MKCGAAAATVIQVTAAMMTSETASGRSIFAAPAANSAPAMPAIDHMPWKLAMMLRPYACCTRTPCMFIPASTAPTPSP